jgi:ribonuclease P protein component
VERRHRLSRSRDFDAVYRQGRSVSTRLLTLHWFAREDSPDGGARVGLAIPRAVGSAVVRNRLKRQLRAVWVELEGEAPAGCDYVLSRVGPRRARLARGLDWLVSEVSEVLGKVGA